MNKVKNQSIEKKNIDFFSKNEIYQKGYEDGRKCMALHIKRMQKKIDKFESEKLKGILGSGLND